MYQNNYLTSYVTWMSECLVSNNFDSYNWYSYDY